MTQAWPITVRRQDEAAEQEFVKLQQVIAVLRQLRNEAKVEPAQVSKVQLVSERWSKLLGEQQAVIERLARVRYAEAQDSWTSHSLGDADIAIDLAKPVDPAALAKEREALRQYIASLEAKLNDQKTSCGAPALVVAQWEAKLADARAKLAKLDS